MQRSVSSFLAADVLAPARIELQISVAGECRTGEQLLITVDGEPVVATELSTDVGGRLHLAEVRAGRLEVAYRCTVTAERLPPPVVPLEIMTYLRPSRYAESDRLAELAAAQFGGITDRADLLRSVAAWVGGKLSYVPGSSVGTDGALDRLVEGTGVCRDYAHLTVAMLRAREVPARVVSVYAPGLDPMDFHAVAEALVDGRWRVVDATLLAPRRSLVRIATGRDAADTAFLSSYGGDVRFGAIEISAVVDGDLPTDDLSDLVTLS